MFHFKPRKTASKLFEKPKTAFGEDDVGKTRSSNLFS
jgi:hypothetical protein